MEICTPFCLSSIYLYSGGSSVLFLIAFCFSFLSLSFFPHSPRSAHLFPILSTFPRLTALDLSYSSTLSSAVLLHLNPLQRTLQELDLSYCRHVDLDFFQGIRLPHLTRLNLTWCVKVDDPCLGKL